VIAVLAILGLAAFAGLYAGALWVRDAGRSASGAAPPAAP
jgi:hypothetical protein